MSDKYTLPPETATPDFAAQAAATEFGHNYIPPADRDFQDRPPPGSQRPDDVDRDTVDEIGRHRIAQPRVKVPA